MIFSLSLLLSFCGFTALNIKLNALAEKEKPANYSSNSKQQKLTTNPDWKELANTWKKLNHLETTHNNNQTYKTYENLNKEVSRVLTLIDKLQKSNLLSENEAFFSKDTLQERFGFLQYQMGIVTCYKMSQLGLQIADRRAQAEKKYDKLENLYKENKINTATFEETKKELIKDIDFIKSHSYESEQKIYNSQMVNLLVLLNK
jgi:hypothetical protein